MFLHRIGDFKMLLTAKELFEKIEFDSLWELLVSKYEYPKKSYEKAKKALETMLEKTPSGKNDCLLLFYCACDNGEHYLDCSLFKQEDVDNAEDLVPIFTSKDINSMELNDFRTLFAEHCGPQGYAFEFSPWEEILGYETNTFDYDLTECAAVIYNEMTFFGYEETHIQNERDSLLATIDDIKNDKAGTRSAAEVFKEMGFMDERTSEEQEESALCLYKDCFETELAKQLALKEHKKI